MTEGEKMVWAAAFAGIMEKNFDAARAASHAEDVITGLRFAVESERLLLDENQRSWFAQAQRMTLPEDES